MQVVSIISTKGGVGKTTTAANLGGFAADTGLRVLLLDLDVQPTLSSYFTLGAGRPGAGSAAAGLSTGGASCRRAGGRAVRGGLAGERRHAARAPDPLAVDAQRRRLATALRHPRRGLRGAAPCARPHAGQSHRRRPRPGQSRLPHASLHAALRAAGPVPQPRHRCGNPARTAHAGRGLAACHRPLPPARRRGTRGAIPAQCASAPDPRTRPRRGDGQGLPEGLRYPDLTPAMQGCLDSDRPDAVIRAQAAEAAQQGIAATPALQLRDRESGKTLLLHGPVEGDALLSAIDLLAAGSTTAAEPALTC